MKDRTIFAHGITRCFSHLNILRTVCQPKAVFSL